MLCRLPCSLEQSAPTLIRDVLCDELGDLSAALLGGSAADFDPLRHFPILEIHHQSLEIGYLYRAFIGFVV